MRALLVTLTLLIAPVALGQELPPGVECPGHPTHNPHNWPDEECQKVANPHFNSWSEANYEEDKHCVHEAMNCEGCTGCCNAQYDEKTGCFCGGLMSYFRAHCEAGAKRTQDNCRLGYCPNHFLAGSGCEGVDPEHRIPGPWS